MQKAKLINQLALGLRGLLSAAFMCLIMTGTALGADKLIVENENGKQCGRARSHILAGVNPAPEGWPATG